MSDLALIEQFADALWMERGLSRNTLAAYQSDLVKTDAWLHEKTGRSLRHAHREDLLGYLAELGMQGRSQGAEPLVLRQEVVGEALRSLATFTKFPFFGGRIRQVAHCSSFRWSWF